MAYYQNNYGNTNSSSLHHPPPPPRPLPNNATQGTHAQRTSSFDAGVNNPYGGDTGQPYRSGTIRNRPEDELYVGSNGGGSGSAQTIPYNSPSMSGYQQTYQAQSPPTNHQAYNPQQYAQTTSQYTPNAFGGVQRTYSTASHQPYNPAAYQDSTLQRQSTVSGAYNFSPGSYTSAAAFPSPPLHQNQYNVSPPAGQHGQQYPFNRTPSQHSAQSPYLPSFSDPSPPLPQHSYAYTPPAPPPLPAPPHSGTYPSEDWQSSPARATSVSRNAQSYADNSRSDSVSRRALPAPPTYPSHDSHYVQIPDHNTYTEYEARNPLPPTPGPPPPQHSPQRTNTTGRHPQSRPLPGPPQSPEISLSQTDMRNGLNLTHGSYDTGSAQDVLFDEVEDALYASTASHRRSPRIEVDRSSLDDRSRQALAPISENGQPAMRRNGSVTNGHLAVSQPQPGSFDYSDESDAEAAGGLAAMRLADEQDAADEARRQSGHGGLFTGGLHPSSAAGYQDSGDPGSDSDFVGVDMGFYGGGYDAHMSYGGAPEALAHGRASGPSDLSHTVSSSGSMRRSGTTSDQNTLYDYGVDTIHPFPPFTAARVDTFGTGGLSEPNARDRRLSFDEGDEVTLMDEQLPQGAYPTTSGEPPEMFWHPGMSTRRPLPPPPPSDVGSPQQTPTAQYQADWRMQQIVQNGRAPYPAGPDMITTPSGALVPRSTSLLNHTSTPQVIAPIRSKTDAEERRLRHQALREAGLKAGSDIDLSTPASSTPMSLDYLPTLPAGKRFNPAKLTPNDFKKCVEPWALSNIISWLRAMAEGETDLKESVLVEGLVALFTNKVPTMGLAEAETISARVVQDMFKVGTLAREEEWLKFTGETMTGVLFQLTGTGCYSPKLHDYNISGRCYAHHCQRTLKKIDLSTQTQRQSEDWATFYKLKKEDVEGVSKKEVERQNILHEIVVGEEGFSENLNVLRVLYRDALERAQPAVLAPKKIAQFIRDVFGKVDAVKKANEEYLLAQLKYRQQEQGPWITGFSDIFREWIRKAKNAYVEYAANFPNASFLIRQESERNMLFRTFLENARVNKMSNKLGWDHFLKAPITRLQHYGLLLTTVLNKMPNESEEKTNLQTAIEEIKNVTLECDSRVAEMSRKVDLADLSSKLILRPGMQRVELNLGHLGRELIYRGDLQRTGGTRFTWLETHALLFDHYLVLAKTVTQRDSAGGLKYERYDVSRLPIPMDLLVLESTNDDAVVKSAVRGVTVANAAARANGPNEGRLVRASSNQSPIPGQLSHTNTSTSVTSVATGSSGRSSVPNAAVETGGKDDNVLYPFRIKHLGKEVYTLYASNAQNRQDWCDKILEAKTKHAASLFAQNAEPFRLRVIADSAFAYDSTGGGPKGIIIRGTPLDRAIEEVNKKYEFAGRPSPVCRARVNCATSFTQANGTAMIAIGTDFGVYTSQKDNPRGWTRAIPIQRVSQVAVLEEFGLFLLIADKALIAYHLDVVCPTEGVAPVNDSARKAPQKLSGSKDVGFFATGRMKDRTLVFYKKREGLSSTFKVLEPVFQKSTEKKSRFLRRGTTEFFRDYDEFYIPTECFGINLFQTSLAVSTSKGFEVLTLDKKQPWSVPDLKQPDVATIASRLAGLDPLGMFRLSDAEFLLCYEECAVYVNKHGEISRSVIMEFVGKAKSAALYGPYILLFDPDFVEIRNAQNGRLRQVIAGRDVKCLDDGLGGGTAGNRTVKLSLHHPELDRMQLIVELVLNEGQRE